MLRTVFSYKTANIFSSDAYNFENIFFRFCICNCFDVLLIANTYILYVKIDCFGDNLNVIVSFT